MARWPAPRRSLAAGSAGPTVCAFCDCFVATVVCSCPSILILCLSLHALRMLRLAWPRAGGRRGGEPMATCTRTYASLAAADAAMQTMATENPLPASPTDDRNSDEENQQTDGKGQRERIAAASETLRAQLGLDRLGEVTKLS
eukprot:COSAG06_NODE_1783_length_8405_cov_109.734595_2_plen_143_part_00